MNCTLILRGIFFVVLFHSSQHFIIMIKYHLNNLLNLSLMDLILLRQSLVILALLFVKSIYK